MGFLAAQAIGCGDAEVGQDLPDGLGGELLGFYDITAQTHNPSGCDAPGPDVTAGPPLFEIYQEPEFGLNMFLRTCSSTSDCLADTPAEAAFVGFSASGLHAEGDRYVGSAFFSFAGEPCRLGEYASVVTRGGEGIHVELRHRELEPATGDACTTDAAEARAAEMTCLELRTLDGTPVP